MATFVLITAPSNIHTSNPLAVDQWTMDGRGQGAFSADNCSTSPYHWQLIWQEEMQPATTADTDNGIARDKREVIW